MSTSSSETSDPVRQEIVGDAMVLTICRPHAGNSIDTLTARKFATILQQHRHNTALRAVVVTGEGGKFFCSGGDLKAYRALKTKAQLTAAFGRVRRLLDAIEAFPLPVIAAIDGYALGGGMELALACDLRFASVGANVGFPQSRLGLIPGWNGLQRLVELVGRSTALKLLYTGERITAEQALDVGLLDGVSQAQTALEYSLSFASRLAAVAPLSLAATKVVAMAALRSPSKTAASIASREFERLWFTRDHREAESAFVEKRPPIFKGR